ncbi:hypothetical protein F5Y15DRAFT_153029 [Xylariaceae sp. FL0016]|nr:hypothetical protein F5Y15DRAFT_153029 [Xylariaceae sp. FL0016]
MSRLVYVVLDINSRVEATKSLSLKKGKEDDRSHIVSPSTKDIYKGPLTLDAVKPATISGTWFHSVRDADVTSKIVVLYFHGGAFVQGDGCDAQCGTIAKKLLQSSGGGIDAVFSVQHRLSGYGLTSPFPAAL